jgi:hypothetical protein
MTVLATACSDPANHGSATTSRSHVLSYGRGRVFHTTLGHDVNALSPSDFVVTLQRERNGRDRSGDAKVPATFPTAVTVSYRSDIAAMDPALRTG